MTRLLASAAACALMLAAAACAESAENAAETAEATAENAIEAVESGAQADAAQAIIDAAPEAAWRTVDPENLLRIRTRTGMVWVEMAPEFAPAHVERIRELARSNYFDFKVFHRVIDGFMAQGGGAPDNPNAPSGLPPVPAEFTIKRSPDTLEITEIQERVINPRANRTRAQAGHWNGFPAGTVPGAQAFIREDGQVESWLLHCDGAAAMARTADPNSGNAQFYIVRGEAEHLNADYTVWGFVRAGMDAVRAIRVGTVGETRGFSPDFIMGFHIASDLPEDERPTVQVFDTATPDFARYIEALTEANNGRQPDICTIPVPVRITE
ncbi:peptidylprolyl isomerase [Alkalicaulis satelles]|uniref:peptidylprolyl isomerase n=1 Tax=Alkalicaulis satelles TaxID=2609175 RepID=A0A5M6ZL94_9PROT|nr:peptidylprolyl isomerase [Alkalicaulis satelles]KAA5805100.1 peptidylprolyl isomerase [Alkalicaulis satelles]